MLDSPDIWRRLLPLTRFLNRVCLNTPGRLISARGGRTLAALTDKQRSYFLLGTSLPHKREVLQSRLVISFFLVGRQGHSSGTSAPLLKQTRAVIDANRVISLYLKGVADSRSIKVKSAPLVTGVIYYCQKQTNNVACQRGGGGGGGGCINKSRRYV